MDKWAPQYSVYDVMIATVTNAQLSIQTNKQNGREKKVPKDGHSGSQVCWRTISYGIIELPHCQPTRLIATERGRPTRPGTVICIVCLTWQYENPANGRVGKPDKWRWV